MMTDKKWQEYPQPPRYVFYDYDAQWMASIMYDAERNSWRWKVFDPDHQMRSEGTATTPEEAKLSAEKYIASNLQDE